VPSKELPWGRHCCLLAAIRYLLFDSGLLSIVRHDVIEGPLFGGNHDTLLDNQ
jgi:hypothetical protein